MPLATALRFSVPCGGQRFQVEKPEGRTAGPALPSAADSSPKGTGGATSRRGGKETAGAGEARSRPEVESFESRHPIPGEYPRTLQAGRHGGLFLPWAGVCSRLEEPTTRQALAVAVLLVGGGDTAGTASLLRQTPGSRTPQKSRTVIRCAMR